MKNKKNIGYGILFILAFAIAIFWLKPDKVENKVEVKTQKTETQEVVSDVLSKKIESEKANIVDIDQERLPELLNTKENPKTEVAEGNLEEDGISADFIAENNLPSYPGKDGGPGVLGTDSNGNEIRDDIEREIFWQYKDFPEEVRNVFLAGVVSATRDLQLGMEKRFDETSLLESRKSMVETVACESYYKSKGKGKDKIPGYKTTKRLTNTEDRLKALTFQEKYIFNSVDFGIEKAEEIYGIRFRTDDEARRYETEIDSQMETDGIVDDKKAQAFCKEISAKYLN